MLDEKEITIKGRFVLGKKIGKGSFGDVYVGYDKDKKKDVAIKFVDVYLNLGTNV